MSTILSSYTNLVLSYYKSVNEINALPATSSTYKRMRLEAISSDVDLIINLLKDKVKNIKNMKTVHYNDYCHLFKDAMDLKKIIDQLQERLATMP